MNDFLKAYRKQRRKSAPKTFRDNLEGEYGIIPPASMEAETIPGAFMFNDEAFKRATLTGSEIKRIVSSLDREEVREELTRPSYVGFDLSAGPDESVVTIREAGGGVAYILPVKRA